MKACDVQCIFITNNLLLMQPSRAWVPSNRQDSDCPYHFRAIFPVKTCIVWPIKMCSTFGYYISAPFLLLCGTTKNIEKLLSSLHNSYCHCHFYFQNSITLFPSPAHICWHVFFFVRFCMPMLLLKHNTNLLSSVQRRTNA